MTQISDANNFLRSLFNAAVDAADPMKAVPVALPERPEGRVVVVGAGKASARMAEALEAAWGPCEGLVITRYGYGRPTKGIEIVEAAHPVPDKAGVEATQRLLALLDTCGSDDFIVALISGGGSSLLCAPRGDMTLADKQACNAALLASGAPIGVMNLIRKQLSEVKGGQFAARAHPAPMLALMISDVPGDDPGEIASGPTVGEDQDINKARALVSQYAIDLPATAMTLLAGESPVIAKDDMRLSRVENAIISAPSQSIEAAAVIARGQGCEVRVLGDALEGEARDLGREQAKLARQIRAQMSAGDAPVLLLSGGECTVTRSGNGIGGPNAEFCLSALTELRGADGIYVLACDTDGVDGGAEVAGAVVTPDIWQKALEAGHDPLQALKEQDSHGFFAKVDAQVIPGPTLTNVNDFRAVLVFPPEN